MSTSNKKRGDWNMQMKIEQKATLAVRPQMIQSVQLLQINTAELKQYLEELSL